MPESMSNPPKAGLPFPDDSGSLKTESITWFDKAALMYLAGLEIEKIARETGKPYNMIAQLPSMPEFRKRVNSLANDETAAEKLLRGSLVDNILGLISLARNAENETVRAKCLMYLTDRVLGKTQEKSRQGATQSTQEKLLGEISENVAPEDAVNKRIALVLEQNPELRYQLGLSSTAQ